MPKKQNNITRKLATFSYNRPALGKHLTEIKKNMGEISSLLNEKKK